MPLCHVALPPDRITILIYTPTYYLHRVDILTPLLTSSSVRLLMFHECAHYAMAPMFDIEIMPAAALTMMQSYAARRQMRRRAILR